MNITNPKTPLFGPNRHRLGHEDQEWAVWVSGMDEIHDADNLTAALELANELNGTFAQLRYNATSNEDPSYMLGAVVLRNGYAWTQDTEHALGLHCGHPQCAKCSPSRTESAEPVNDVRATLTTLTSRWEEIAASAVARAKATANGTLGEVGHARAHTIRRLARDVKDVLRTGKIPHDLMTTAELEKHGAPAGDRG